MLVTRPRANSSRRPLDEDREVERHASAVEGLYPALHNRFDQRDRNVRELLNKARLKVLKRVVLVGFAEHVRAHVSPKAPAIQSNP